MVTANSSVRDKLVKIATIAAGYVSEHNNHFHQEKHLVDAFKAILSLATQAGEEVVVVENTETQTVMSFYVEESKRTLSESDQATINRVNMSIDCIHACFGLSTEVGELIDQYKKHIFYGKRLDAVNIYEEIGDIMWYLAIVLRSHGIDLEECVMANIAKLRARYPEKFSQLNAINRDTDKEIKALTGQE